MSHSFTVGQGGATWRVEWCGVGAGLTQQEGRCGVGGVAVTKGQVDGGYRNSGGADTHRPEWRGMD